MKISNELLSEVLGVKAYVMQEKYIHFLHNSRRNDLVYEKSGDIQYNINVYELAFKCKEWAYNQGYILKSEIDGCLVSKKTSFMGSEEDWVSGVSEIEAVIKACEYILQQRKKGV